MTSHLSLLVLALTLLGISPALTEDRSFKNDVMPIFFKSGCNAGDCHGAGTGKDGFMLSLFGYDPEGDYYRLVEEYVGRRVNLAAPKTSLLLEKAIGSVAHSGGELFTEDSESYQILLEWLEDGAPRDADDAPYPTGIHFELASHRFDKPGPTLDTKVLATYSDGTERDVTRWSTYMTNNESVSPIDDNGKVTARSSGGGNVIARFDKFSVGMEITVLPETPVEWPEPDEANYIDSLVFAKLKDLQILPSETCSDEAFLRRVTIDLNATLPSADDFRNFLADDDPNKRAKLVDRLLDDDYFGELWAARWGEWLKIRTDTNPGYGTAMKAGWNYYHWLREHFIENRPLDELASSLVTGTGSNIRNPPASYYTMLPQGKLDPMKLGEDTAQIFLGIQTGCAMCHNHPFDRWTMDDYYAWTSFFTSVRRKHGTEAREYFTYVDLEAEAAKHPVYDTAMDHRFLGGDYPDIEDKDPRKVLATWMTDPSNDLFRENLANRIWSHMFGRGIIDPIDDIRISNPPSIPALLTELGRKLGEDYGYDQKKLIRDICLSKTYQTSATTNDSNRRDDRFFSHSSVRRMRADVLFDCITVATDAKPTFRRSTADRAVTLFEGGLRDDHNSYFFTTFGQAQRESVCACEDKSEATLGQALNLINGKTVHSALNRNPTLVPHLIEYLKEPKLIIEELYIRCLTRKPTPKELKAMIAEIPKNADDPTKNHHDLRGYYNDVLWALLNSSEFMFNH